MCIENKRKRRHYVYCQRRINGDTHMMISFVSFQVHVHYVWEHLLKIEHKNESKMLGWPLLLSSWLAAQWSTHHLSGLCRHHHTWNCFFLLTDSFTCSIRVSFNFSEQKPDWPNDKECEIHRRKRKTKKKTTTHKLTTTTNCGKLRNIEMQNKSQKRVKRISQLQCIHEFAEKYYLTVLKVMNFKILGCHCCSTLFGLSFKSNLIHDFLVISFFACVLCFNARGMLSIVFFLAVVAFFRQTNGTLINMPKGVTFCSISLLFCASIESALTLFSMCWLVFGFRFTFPDTHLLH